MHAYPLSWPSAWPRTSISERQASRFAKKKPAQYGSWKVSARLTLAEGLGRVLDELARMGIERQDVIVSSDVPTRIDGLPRSGAREPDDSGAAVYWQERGGARRVLAIDQYQRVADNLAAIAATLEALRAVERHGGARILERAFTGFTALAAPAPARTWRNVLGFLEGSRPTIDEAANARRRLASVHHPDKGGTDAAMAEINAAYAQACAEL